MAVAVSDLAGVLCSHGDWPPWGRSKQVSRELDRWCRVQCSRDGGEAQVCGPGLDWSGIRRGRL